MERMLRQGAAAAVVVAALVIVALIGPLAPPSARPPTPATPMPEGPVTLVPADPGPQPHRVDWSAPPDKVPAYVKAERGPDQRVPISLAIADEGADGQGRWYQTIRVTIELYGALSYVSEAIYGDLSHVDQLFDLVRQQHPQITKPEQIAVGLTFDVVVDPATTYVIRETKVRPDGTKVRTYFNGVVEELPSGDGPIHRAVTAPAGDRTPGFRLTGLNDQPVVLKPGQKLVLYQQMASDSLRDALTRIYGTSSYTALQDFFTQIDFAHRRSLKPGDQFQLVVETRRSYEDPRPARGMWMVDDPAAKARFAELARQWAEAGIHLAEVGPTFGRFLVGVYSPKTTAKDVARLLYGGEQHYDHLIDVAGLWPPSSTPGEKPPLPADYNPSLFGHLFAVNVDLADQHFIWQQERDPAHARINTVLLSGTHVAETLPIARRVERIQRIIHYPSGQIRIEYRPSDLTMTAIDGVLFISQIFLDPPVTIDPRDQRLNAKLAELRKRRLAQLPAALWRWDPLAPREYDGTPVEVGWALGGEGSVVQVTLPAEQPAGPIDRLLGNSSARLALLGALLGIGAAGVIILKFHRSQTHWSSPFS